MKQYPPYSEGTAETMSKLDWDFDHLHLQIEILDSIDCDVQSGVLETNLAKAYEHLKLLDQLVKDLDDDNALWLQKHEEDLDERFIYCSPDFRAIIVELSPALPAWKRADLMHQTIRDQINRVSRLGLGTIKIMDLPNEVLSRISAFVLDESLPEVENSREKQVRHIKSLRLTCWRFHNACSCLLIRTLSVDMTPKSISRLDSLSRHPTLSKGIRTILVFLDFYDSVMARDLNTFARYHATHFMYLTRKMENLSNANHWGMSVEVLRGAAKKGSDYIEEWTDLFNGFIPAETDTPYLRVLREAHKKYQAEYEVQKTLREGSFLAAVAAAFGRMKTVEKLEIRDERAERWDGSDHMYERRGRPRCWEVVHDEEAMVESMVFPTMWEHTQKREYPCIDHLTKLPVAIHRSGGCLTTLNICISGPKDLTLFATENHHLEDLTNSITTLKSFSFSVTDGSVWSHQRARGCQHVGNFLTHILDTSNLEKLTLDLSFLWDDDELHSTPNLLSILNPKVLQKWEHISILNLAFLPVRMQDIEALVKYVIKPRVRINFNAILLLDGNWDVVLDILRKQTGPHTKFSDLRYTSGRNPWAGMYTASRDGSYSEDEGDRISGAVSCTKIEAYLRGLIDYNPLREQESMEEHVDSGPDDSFPGDDSVESHSPLEHSE